MFQAASLLDQHRSGRRLGNEGKRAILIHRDNHGDDQADLLGGAVVKLLAEAGDVHAVLTKRGADRRRGRGLAGIDLQLDQRGNFLCH